MKFLVKDNSTSEPTLTLSLVQREDGVDLQAVDNNGQLWNLGKFRNGRFERLGYISEKVGLKLDLGGRIQVV